MKIKLGRALKTVARKAKENPEVALMLVGLVAPKLAVKAAPHVAKAITIAKVVR